MKTARSWLGGFLLLGLVFGMPGSLVIAWRYHIGMPSSLIGLHFLALNAGYVWAAGMAPRLVGKLAIKAAALIACGLILAGLLALGLAAPPMAVPWRLAALATIGFGAGGLGTAVLYASASAFRAAPAQSGYWAALFFGGGCLLSTVVAGASYLAVSMQFGVGILAMIAFANLVVLARMEDPPKQPRVAKGQDEPAGHRRSVATVLFSLLTFFQFGAEWAIAGWLPLFLIRRFGTNPALAIGILALYFLVVLLGREAAPRWLKRVDRRASLIGCVAVAMCGSLMLSLAHSVGDAAFAAILAGLGFGPILPLVAGQLDHRFAFHPGFYNRVIAIAVTGAMTVPWLLGLVDASLGMRWIVLAPAIGSAVVLLLSLLLWLEAHLMGEDELAAASESKRS